MPPQVGNLDSRPLTTSLDSRLLLESGRDVSPVGRSSLDQEEAIRRLCPKKSKCGGTPYYVERQTDQHEGAACNAGRVRWLRRLILLEQEAG